MFTSLLLQDASSRIFRWGGHRGQRRSMVDAPERGAVPGSEQPDVASYGFPVFLAGMPDMVRSKLHRMNPNDPERLQFALQKLHARDDVREEEYDYDGAAVHAVAIVKPVFVLDGFSRLSRDQEMFREYFAQVSGEPNVEHLFFMKVKEVVKLPLRQLPALHSKCSIQELRRWFVQALVDDAEVAWERRGLPPWVSEQNCQVVIHVPKPLAALISNGLLKDLAVCELSARVRPSLGHRGMWAIGWGRGQHWIKMHPHIKDLKMAFDNLIMRRTYDFYSSPPEWIMRAHQGMPAHSMRQLLASTRDAIAHIPASSREYDQPLQTTLRNLHDVMVCLEHQVDMEKTGSNASSRRGHNVSALVNSFMAAHLLKNDGELLNMCCWCARLVLPKLAAADVEQRLRGKNQVVPSASTIRRTRSKMDVAWMLHMRDVIASFFKNDGGCVVFVMADKSPQGGREYEMTVFDFIPRKKLGWLHCAISHMDDWRAHANYK